MPVFPYNSGMMKTMTEKEYHKQFEMDWKEWQEMMKTLPTLTRMQVRSGASYRLNRELEGTGCGIGSSDINHEMFGIWKGNGKDKDAYVQECVELYEERINA
jgi:hypothetical protein